MGVGLGGSYCGVGGGFGVVIDGPEKGARSCESKGWDRCSRLLGTCWTD